MAGGLLEYSGLVTKTKAMRARLLGADDYTAISEYESVTDFIAFLREQPAYAPVFERHGEVAHRGQVEAVIRDSLYMDYCKLYRFSGVQPRRALQFVFSRYEINVIKNCLQSAMEGNGQEITVSGGFFERHADFDLKAVMAANSVQELIQAVTGTENENLFKEIETAAEKKYADYAFICGIDEVGRGPLAGPVVAGAVILPKDCNILYINDSKKLSEKKREELYDVIMEQAVVTGIGMASPARIDEINILQATYEAMREAISKLDPQPDLLLNDAVTIPEVDIYQVPIIKGDAKSISIGAASIIAKVTRDRLMVEYDKVMPEYGFASNKGYGSAAHIAALKKYGASPIHRQSFIHNFI